MNTNKELWAFVPGFPKYAISTFGRIYSFHRNIIIKQTYDRDGYLKITLSKEGKKTTFQVHRLVAASFLDNPKGLETVNHINHIRDDNRIENLEWMSRTENSQDGTCKKVVCVETGEVYHSMIEASKKLGLNDSAVTGVCGKPTRTAGGYHWRLLEE